MNEKTTQKNLINKEALLRIGEDNSVQTTGTLGAVQRGAVKRASVINRIDLGIEQRRSRGLIQETGISLAKGAYNVGSGLVRTAAFLADPTGEMGHGEIRRGIDRFESTRGGFVRGAKDKSLPTTVVSGIAEQLPNILMSMAGVGAGMSIARAAEVGALGKVAAVKAGQVASLGIWRYGAIRDDLHKASNGRLSDASINWTAFMATSLEAGLETMFGPEQVIAKMSIMKALGKATGKTGMARAIATGTFGEFSTEAIQSISESLFQDFAAEGLGGLDLTIDDVKQAITEGVMAIPTAMLFGGVQSFAEYRVESGALDRQRGIDADKKTVLEKYTTPDEKANAETRIEKAFLDFGAKLSAKFGDTGGKALTFAMREHAYHWAAQNNTDPDLSIAEFEVIFSDTELSQTQIEEIRAITDPTQHAAWMRENVQGYREFDAGKTEKYLIDATEQQIQFELKKLRRIFGDDFRSDIIDTEAQTQEDVEDNAQADAAEAGRAPKPSDAVNDIRAQRIESIKRLRKLRQDAALRVKEIPITDRQAHLDYTTITKAAASDMYRALTDPDADASWIDPAAMRENLAGMIYLNNPGMTREAAYDIAQSLGDEQMAGMDGTELRAAFMLEAASSEIEGHYDIDELTDSIRVLSRNDKAWASFVSGQRSQAMHEAMLQAAERADIDRIRLAELVLSHANEVSREASSGLVVRETTDRDNTGTEQMLDRIAENSGKLRAMIYEGGDAVAMAEVVGLIENDVAELSDLVEQVKIDVLKRDIGFDPGKDAAQDLDGFGPDAVPVADEAAEQPGHIQAEAERLFESAFKKEVFAHYDFAKRRATFYKNATAEDVLHEWFHHVEMNGLLPPEMKAAMDKHYGINKDSTETDKRLAREKSARDFVAYVKTTSEGGIAGIETDQPEEMRRAFDYLRAVFAETYKADKGFSMPGGQQESSHIDMPGGMEAEISEWGKKKGLTDSAIGDLIRKSTESWFGGDVASLKERFKGNAILEARAEGAEQNSAKNVDIRSKTQMDLDLRESSTDGVIEYKPEVREFFEGAFDNVTAEAHQKAIAEILIESGQERPPVADTEANRMYESGDVITLTDKTKLRQRAFSFTPNGWDKLEWFRNSISEVAGVEYVKGESRSDLWNGFSIPQMQQVAQKTMDAHEAAGITGKAYFSKSQLDTAAAHVNPNAKTFNDLGPDERKQAISLLGSIARATVAKLTKKLKTTEARKKAISTGLSLFNAGINAMESIRPSKRGNANEGGGSIVSKKDRFITEINEKGERAIAIIEAYTSDVESFMEYLDDGNGSGIFKKTIFDPLHEAGQNEGAFVAKTDEWLIEIGDKYGAQPDLHEFGEIRYYGKEGKKLTLEEAIFIYMATDRGRSKKDVESLFGSNADKLGTDSASVITDVKNVVEGAENANGFIRYVKKKGKNDWSHSKKPRKGYVKTTPALNYAKAQMEFMKRIYPELNAVHMERTGKKLGNQFKDGRKYFAPFMRVGQTWAIGSAATDLFIVDEAVRQKLVTDIFAKDKGADVKFEDLTQDEREQVFAQEEHTNAHGPGRPQVQGEGRSRTVSFLESKGLGYVGSKIKMEVANVFEQYRANAAIFATKVNTLDYLEALVSKEEFRRGLKKIHGDESFEIYHDAILKMINRERFVGGRDYIDTAADRAVRKLQGTVMPAVLGGRISSQLIQTASGFRALAYMNGRESVRYMGNAVKIMRQIGSDPRRLADALIMRDNPLTGDTEVGGWFRHMAESSPEILRRLVNPEIQDVVASGQMNRGPAAHVRAGRGTLVDATMGGFRVMDLSTVLNVYHTSYVSKMTTLRADSVSGGTKMTTEQMEKIATSFAAKVVRRTQPPSTTTDRNLLQTARPTQRMWYPFSSDTMKQFQLVRRDIMQPVWRGYREGAASGGVAGGFKGAMSALGKYTDAETTPGKAVFIGMLIPMTVVGLIKRRREPDDMKEWATDMLGYTVSTIPVLGPLFQRAITSNYEIGGMPIAMMPFAEAAKAMQAFKKEGLLYESGELNVKAFNSFFRSIETATGFPLVATPWLTGMVRAMLESDDFDAVDRTKLEWMLEMVSLPVASRPSEED